MLNRVILRRCPPDDASNAGRGVTVVMTSEHFLVSHCDAPLVGCASLLRVRSSRASAGSVWPAAHTPAERCSDSDGPTAAACPSCVGACVRAAHIAAPGLQSEL